MTRPISSSNPQRYLALDLGATSGRTMLGMWDGRNLSMRELARFANGTQAGPCGLVWPIDSIIENYIEAIRCAAADEPVVGIACDAWAVDHGFLDAQGSLLAPPFSYQDAPRTKLGADVFAHHLTPTELFRQAGSPYIAISTLHQWLATRQQAPELLKRAERMLMIPDLVAQALSGASSTEFSSASTTAMCDWRTRDWNRPLLRGMNLPDCILPPIVEAGTCVGTLRPTLCAQHQLPAIPVHQVAGHDTASAVIGSGGAPAGELVISSGTWLMLALRVEKPVLADEALARGIGCYGLPSGGWMLIAGIMGLYLLERLRTEESWPAIPELCAMAENAPAFGCLFDPTREDLTGPGRLRTMLAEQVAAHGGGAIPAETETLARAVLEALALYAAESVDLLERLSGQRIERLRVVGGGVRNQLLNRFLAGATGRPVMAGDPEAAARGNLALQLLATREVANLDEACHIAAAGEAVSIEPAEHDAWASARARFRSIREKDNTMTLEQNEGAAHAGATA